MDEITGPPAYHGLSLVAGRYVPGFATIAPPLAGAMRIGFWRFLGPTAVSAFLWAIAPLLDGRRIPGAVAVDILALEAGLAAVPPDRDVVCSRPNEASAARVARQLMKKGFRRVRPLEGGLDAWVEAGGEIALHEPIE